MKTKWPSIIIGAIIGILAVQYFAPYDSTDDRVNKVRSNMALRVDYGTGCQYLASPGLLGGGSLIPRVDAEGKHICNQVEAH